MVRCIESMILIHLIIRVLRAPDVSEEKKRELRERKAELSYPELLQKIYQLTKKLDRAYRNKYPHRDDEEE